MESERVPSVTDRFSLVSKNIRPYARLRFGQTSAEGKYSMCETGRVGYPIFERETKVSRDTQEPREDCQPPTRRPEAVPYTQATSLCILYQDAEMLVLAEHS
jgi:hypothetical protein